MNNLNMAGMNAMGGPVGGGGMPMMNNGIAGANRPLPGNDNQQRSQLNTYIYEYFLRNEMYDCARAIINSDQPINVHKNSPARRRDVNRNLADNGVSPEGTDGDSKDDLDSKRPDDLPAPNLPKECPESCFLYEWWCLFWDMFNAQRGKGDSRNVMQYVNHTQANSRSRQEQQQAMLRQIHRPDMMSGQYQMLRNQPNGMNMGSNDIARKAMHNNRNVTPQQLHMLQAQQQQQQHQKQQQMQRDGSDLDGSRRPQSPGSVENAPSPSKRPRLEGAPFNGPQGMMPNGRGQQQGMPGQQVGPANSALQTSQLLLNSGMNPNNMTAQQYQQFQGSNQAGQTKALQSYNTNLAQHQQNQMPNNKGMPNPGVPQGQNSPMMAQGQDNGQIANYYNAGEMGANGMRPGTGGQPGSGGNHALQDYQMQLMLLEQQNKKRLMMARQEQDNMGGMPRDGPGGPGVPGSNGQQFQGTSPQGGRSGTSPNLSEMKRGTPQMAAGGMPSPLPEAQSRGSPSAMSFMPGQIDPNMAPHFYKQMGGMDGNMVAGMPNGMRPPSSVPANFSGQMNQQQQMMNMAARQQQQGGVGQVQGWQAGPNGTPIIQQTSQVPVPQSMGTPQQRAMPPPPTAGAPANGRTQPSSPQQAPAPPTPSQSNKSKPKGKKDAKPKRPAKATTTTGATPAAAAADEPATPTPAPITPIHPQSFKNGQNGGGQNPPNGQQGVTAAVTAPTIAPPQPDPTQNTFMDDNAMFNIQMDFANPITGGTADVLQDFDFDSFLHQDGEQDGFAFDASAYMEGGEVGAE